MRFKIILFFVYMQSACPDRVMNPYPSDHDSVAITNKQSVIMTTSGDYDDKIDLPPEGLNFDL